MKETTLQWFVLKGTVACLLLGMIFLTGCGGDSNPLKDDSGTINPSKDKQKVVENLSVETAAFNTGDFPANSSSDDAPELSIGTVEVTGIKAQGGQDSYRVSTEERPSSILSAPKNANSRQSKVRVQSENAHTLIRIRPGQTINPVINFSTSLEDIEQAQVNVAIQGADGYFAVGKEAFFTPSSCRLKIKTSTDFRPGTFQIIVNITDNFLDVTSQNNVVIDVVVTGEPSDDPNRLIVGKWIVKYQAPLPPYFSQDYRGESIEFKENKTAFVYNPDGSPSSKAGYEFRIADGVTGLYFKDTYLWEPTSQQWIPMTPAKYKIEGLNLTTMMFTELEGYGRALIFERE